MRWGMIAAMAAALAGGCEKNERLNKKPVVDDKQLIDGDVIATLAHIRNTQFDAPDKNASVLVVSERAISMGDQEIVSIRDWELDPAALDNRPSGLGIARLTDVIVKRRKAAGTSATALNLAFHRDTPYEIATAVMVSAMQRDAGIKTVHFLVNDGGNVRALSSQLPDLVGRSSDPSTKKPRDKDDRWELSRMFESPDDAGAGFDPVPETIGDEGVTTVTLRRAERPLGLIVYITRKNANVWSTSGEEGTPSKPKARLRRRPGGWFEPGALHAVLSEIATRRWNGKARKAGDHSLTLAAEFDIPMHVVLKLIAEARGVASGDKLFHQVTFATMLH